MPAAARRYDPATMSALPPPDELPDGDPADLPPVPDAGGDPVRWTYYTSGTTSDPKGVMHSDASLIAGGVGLARALDMQADDVGTTTA